MNLKIKKITIIETEAESKKDIKKKRVANIINKVKVYKNNSKNVSKVCNNKTCKIYIPCTGKRYEMCEELHKEVKVYLNRNFKKTKNNLDFTRK